jgi:predicted Zn-dependent peptidase
MVIHGQKPAERGVNVTVAQFQSGSIGNVRLHVCSSDKFKTTTLMALIQQELKPETVTRNALIPNVLQRGTVSRPTMLELRRKLEEMYGAVLFGDVFKRGERHILHFGMELANEQYLREKQSLLDEGVAFFAEVMTRPLLENGAFKAAYVEAEKKVLAQKIESLIDDKIRYAAKRLIEEMCKGEPFALFNQGNVEDLPSIDATGLFTYYKEMLETCPIDFYCVGNVTYDEVAERLQSQFSAWLSGARKEVPVPAPVQTVEREKTVVDRLDVKQGKLNMGLRTGTTAGDPDYPALLMYNGILGGFPHSKLFMNVREKASLAYYCSSRLESHKGILTIQSGIEIANFEKAVTIIKQQLEAMKNGDISDEEMEKTRALLINQLREQQDRPVELIQFHYSSLLAGKSRTVQSLLEEIKNIRREDVQNVAQKVRVDTIYFLRDQGGDNNAKN